MCPDNTSVYTLVLKSFGGIESETMLTQRANPLYQRLRGGSNLQCCIPQDSKHNTLPTELFQPLKGSIIWYKMSILQYQRVNTKYKCQYYSTKGSTQSTNVNTTVPKGQHKVQMSTLQYQRVNTKCKCQHYSTKGSTQSTNVNMMVQQEEYGKCSNNPYSPYLQDLFAIIFLTLLASVDLGYIMPIHNRLTASSIFLVTLGPWVKVKVIKTGIKMKTFVMTITIPSLTKIRSQISHTASLKHILY